MDFQIEIVTPERIAYTDRVTYVSVPSALGTLGILPKHAPLVAQLIEGEVKIKKNSDEVYLAIGGGYIEVTKDKVMILVTRALHADELNEQEILRAQKEAETALQQKPTPETFISAQALLRQSLVDLKLLNRKRKKIFAT